MNNAAIGCFEPKLTIAALARPHPIG